MGCPRGNARMVAAADRPPRRGSATGRLGYGISASPRSHVQTGRGEPSYQEYAYFPSSSFFANFESLSGKNVSHITANLWVSCMPTT